MFFHNFKYTLKILLKSKSLIFWTFMFPIVLGLFFSMAFSNIESSEKLAVFDIAVVDNEKYQNDLIFKETMTELSGGEDALFSIKYTTQEEAQELLNKKEITGYVLLDETPIIKVTQSGINETILQTVVENIFESKKIVQTSVEEKIKKEIEAGNYQINTKEIAQDIIKIVNENYSNIEDISSKNISYTMIEFYTLIAMTCLYGGILAMTAINQNLPNMSSIGKRVGVSPMKHGILILGSTLASYFIQLIGLLLLFLFTIFILRVDYGPHLGLVVLLGVLGSLAGLSIGIFVSSVFKTNENTKVGIIIGITMFGSFLSGMMGITMKYVIDTNIPILNILNPANMITDGLYSLYYYDTFNRFTFNVISLILFAALLLGISVICLRREKSDSI